MSDIFARSSRPGDVPRRILRRYDSDVDHHEGGCRARVCSRRSTTSLLGEGVAPDSSLHRFCTQLSRAPEGGTRAGLLGRAVANGHHATTAFFSRIAVAERHCRHSPHSSLRRAGWAGAREQADLSSTFLASAAPLAAQADHAPEPYLDLLETGRCAPDINLLKL